MFYSIAIAKIIETAKKGKLFCSRKKLIIFRWVLQYTSILRLTSVLPNIIALSLLGHYVKHYFKFLVKTHSVSNVFKYQTLDLKH